MSSPNRLDDLLDIQLQHTLKNWAARTEAPKDAREKLLAAAVEQKNADGSNYPLKRRLYRLLHSKTVLSERSVFPGYSYALDTVYVIKASSTVA